MPLTDRRLKGNGGSEDMGLVLGSTNLCYHEEGSFQIISGLQMAAAPSPGCTWRDAPEPRALT